MVQFWAHKEVVFVPCCVLQFVYCAVVVAEDFDAMEVCCETVVTCVEPGICDCLISGFIFVVLMFCHCVLLDEAMASWENFSCVFCFVSLLIVSKLSDVFFSILLPTLCTYLTLRRLMSYIYGAPILDVSRSHTTAQHSR